MNKYIREIKYPKIIIYVYFLIFSICPAFAFDNDNKNILLIALMLISPFIILRQPKFSKNDLMLLGFIFTIIFFPLIIHSNSTRWSTVLYSVLFCLSFLAFSRLLKFTKFTLKNYENLLKYLIYAYFIVLVIQQISVLLGIPILNVRFYQLSNPWKLNSLGAEPSWSARIVGLLMYCYISIRELAIGRMYNLKTDFKKDRNLWIAFFWVMLTTGSATAFIFIFIVLSKIIHSRNFIKLLLLSLIIFGLLFYLEYMPVIRFYNVVLSLITLDPEVIIESDHSASFRIVPFVVLISEISLNTLTDWFGYGVDYVYNVIDFNIPGADKLAAGGLLLILFDYGFISFLIFIVFSLKITINKKETFTSLLIWVFLVFSYGLNVQIPWLALMMLTTNKYFYSLKKRNLC